MCDGSKPALSHFIMKENEMQYQYDATTGKLNKVVEDLATGGLEEPRLTDQNILYHVNEKLDQIVKLFKDLENRIEDVEARLETVEGDAQEYCNKVEDMQYTVDEVKEQVEDFDPSRVEDFENELQELKDTLRNV